jgi:hypothetical protein
MRLAGVTNCQAITVSEHPGDAGADDHGFVRTSVKALPGAYREGKDWNDVLRHATPEAARPSTPRR